MWKYFLYYNYFQGNFWYGDILKSNLKEKHILIKLSFRKYFYFLFLTFYVLKRTLILKPGV